MLAVIELHASYIKFRQPSAWLENKVKEAFSWEDPKAKFMLRRHREKHRDPSKYRWCYLCRWDGTECLYRNGCLPVGFLGRVLELMDEWGVTCEVDDCRPPKPERQYDWHYDRELRPYQQEIVEAVMASPYGVVEAATGAGKTCVAAALVCELGVPSIILTPTKIVWQQFWDEFTQHTDIPIGRVASGKYEEAPVQIAITKSLIGTDGKPKGEFLQDKQLLLIDEFHVGASASWEKIITACPAYYRFGFSATPFRSTDLECQMLTGMAGEVVAKISTEELQDEGYLCRTDIKMVPVTVAYDRSTQDDYGDWRDTTFAERYRQGIVENFERNDHIARLAQYHYDRGEKVLVIVAWTEHAEWLLPWLPDDTIFLSGHDTQKKTREKRDEFKSRPGGVLLGSPVVDVGMDVPQIDVCIMAGGGSYEGRQRQRLGRGLRPAPGKDCVTVYDFQDDDRQNGGRAMFWQHSKARIRAYKSVGQSVAECKDLDAALGCELALGVGEQ